MSSLNRFAVNISLNQVGLASLVFLTGLPFTHIEEKQNINLTDTVMILLCLANLKEHQHTYT